MERILEFNGRWRDYQKRILDNLNYHLSDNKIHVVAAPGAGKTTLGIEVIARLNKPTLILVPTITIRNQWKQRIQEAFLKDPDEDIISLSIREPKFITVITYQALLAAFCGSDKNLDTVNETETDEEDEEFLAEEEDSENKFKRLNKAKADEVIQIIKNANIDILCFDEAHHLRNEWWKALTYLINNLKPKQTISLTATPPYDAEGTEWERYSSLCGSIDEVISIPELVKNGDLCPHQDFIHFSLLRKSETDEINKTIQKINMFLSDIMQNQDLIKFMEDFLNNEKIENIFEEPKLYTSVASFLKAAGASVSEKFLMAFEADLKDIPNFNQEYQKTFLSFILLKGSEKFPTHQELFDNLSAKAKTAGIIYNKAIYLADSPKVKRQIANSVGKLDSIKEIVEIETNEMQENLRMVILADYIKQDNIDCTALGVIPIWQTLKDRDKISLCVLTGSIILIPNNIKKAFEDKINERELNDFVSMSPFERDANYLKITPKGAKRSVIVEVITEMFNEGLITVMVGTQALLGEGWDAPCINSLILSSTVSSYMLSNQMRGRAIRKDKNCPNKISNIWHLASVKVLNLNETLKQILPSSAGEEKEEYIQIFDYFQLEQRFKGYEAPSTVEPYYIQNGIERILPRDFVYKMSRNLLDLQENDFMQINNIMKSRAVNRYETKLLWEKGLIKKYSKAEQTLRTGTSTRTKMKTLYYTAGYYYTLMTYFSIFAVVFAALLESRLEYLAYLSILGFVIAMARPTYKHLQCSSPEKIMRRVGIVILETLIYMKEIKTNKDLINLQCEENPLDRSVFFSAGNLSPEENNLLIKSIMEFLNPIENPRYLFIRKGSTQLTQTTDYHSIPSVIGQKKEYVDVFKDLWERYIGRCNIIYTRSIEGRKTLIKARKVAFSSLVQEKTMKLSRFE